MSKQELHKQLDKVFDEYGIGEHCYRCECESTAEDDERYIANEKKAIMTLFDQALIEARVDTATYLAKNSRDFNGTGAVESKFIAHYLSQLTKPERSDV